MREIDQCPLNTLPFAVIVLKTELNAGHGRLSIKKQTRHTLLTGRIRLGCGIYQLQRLGRKRQTSLLVNFTDNTSNNFFSSLYAATGKIPLSRPPGISLAAPEQQYLPLLVLNNCLGNDFATQNVLPHSDQSTL
jgi:hypothetical protein